MEFQGVTQCVQIEPDDSPSVNAPRGNKILASVEACAILYPVEYI